MAEKRERTYKVVQVCVSPEDHADLAKRANEAQMALSEFGILQGFDPAASVIGQAEGRCSDEGAGGLHRGLGLPDPSRRNQHSNQSYPDNFDS